MKKGLGMKLTQANYRCDEGSLADVQRPRQHYCRGCGRELPLSCRRHFHEDCLRADKRLRISEQRRREDERFKRMLARQVCPHCGTRFGGQRSEGNVETPCEASQPTLERDQPPG